MGALRDAVKAKMLQITLMREEILSAFAAKYGIDDPADMVMVERRMPFGTEWFVRHATADERAQTHRELNPPPRYEPYPRVWVSFADRKLIASSCAPRPPAKAAEYILAEHVEHKVDEAYSKGFEHAQQGVQEVHLHPTMGPAGLPDKSAERPFCRVAWDGDAGDPNVGIPTWFGWCLATDQNGTILADLIAQSADAALGRELRTHLGGIRRAFEIAWAADHRENRSYWAHEIKALDDAERAGAAPAAPVQEPRVEYTQIGILLEYPGGRQEYKPLPYTPDSFELRECKISNVYRGAP
jgi:hypothetical protein